MVLILMILYPDSYRLYNNPDEYPQPNSLLKQNYFYTLFSVKYFYVI